MPHLPWHLYRLYELYQTQGGQGVIRGIQDYLRNRDGIRRLYVQNRDKSDVDNFNVIYVDPAKITHGIKYRDRYIAPGVVYSGRWDQILGRFEERLVPKSLIRHFRHGVQWEDTLYYQEARMRVESGRQYRGCSSFEELNDHFKSYDRLYEEIKTSGYERTVATDGADTIREIGVSIGRGGELYWQKEGQHRLTIAKLLNLDRIPVQVAVRHAKWQDVRDKLRATPSRDSLDDSVTQHLPHPDLEDIMLTDDTGKFQ